MIKHETKKKILEQMKINNFLKTVIFLIVFIIGLLQFAKYWIPAHLVEDRTFWQDTLDLHPEINSLLIQEGYCKKVAPCEVYAFSPKKGGFEFIIYNIYDPLILARLNKIALDKFNATPQMKQIVISSYKRTAIRKTEAIYMHDELISSKTFKK